MNIDKNLHWLVGFAIFAICSTYANYHILLFLTTGLEGFINKAIGLYEYALVVVPLGIVLTWLVGRLGRK